MLGKNKKIDMVNALILNKNNQALLVHNCKEYKEYGIKNNRWEFPGGKVKETDKSLEEAVIREVEEELGKNKGKKNLPEKSFGRLRNRNSRRKFFM